MASLVTAPLERQFGQIPALSTMVSSSSFGVSQISFSSISRATSTRLRRSPVGHRRRRLDLAAQLPYPPVYAKVNPSTPRF